MKDPMKPCSHNKEALAWLALDSLPSDDATRLRAHLDACAGCRRYWAELRVIVRNPQGAAEALTEARLGEAFYRRLQERIQADAARPALVRSLAAAWRRVSSIQAVSVTAAAAIVVAGLALLWLARPPGAPSPQVPANPPLPERQAAGSPPPTFSAYRLALNTSPDALEELLTRQAARCTSAGDAKALHAFRRTEVE
jgi:anti-sigma factor RsiW